MSTTGQIRLKYKKLHDELAKKFYTKKHSTGVTEEEQEEFNKAHAEIWAGMEEDLKKASDYVEPVAPRDIEAELDELKERVKKLEAEP